MCFNAPVSLFTFILGTSFSLLLINHGNKKYASENYTTGLFLIFISAVQLMEFFLWIDLKNKLGLNKITTILGPILVIGQPLIFYIIKLLYYKPNITLSKNFDLPIAILNIIYLVYFIINYRTFLTNGSLVTTIDKKRLDWPWLAYFNPLYYYNIMLAINIFYLFSPKYAAMLLFITYFFLMLSVKYFSHSSAEIWCFFGAFISLIMYYISFYL